MKQENLMKKKRMKTKPRMMMSKKKRRTNRVTLRRRKRWTGLPLKIVQKNIVVKVMMMTQKRNQLIP